MIDIIEAKKAFKEYVKNYNPNDGKIALKISHIMRVSEESRKIAEYLNLSREDTQLAELIGLLHDIGRFEQIKRYNTFMDKDSINHAEFGVQILFEDNLIRKFIKTNQYDEIIKTAILNHNKPRIEENELTEKEIMHCKIIRDADKIDIYYVLITEELKNSYGSENIKDEEISEEIFNEFKNDHIINYKNIKTSADLFVAHIAYVFDFYYEYSLKIIKEHDYINRLEQKIDFKNAKTLEYIDKINYIVNKYINECIK